MRLSGFLSFLGCCVALCGCGRVSPPALPEGSFYPHIYVVEESKDSETKSDSSSKTDSASKIDSSSKTDDSQNELLSDEADFSENDIFTLEEAQKAAADFAESIYD